MRPLLGGIIETSVAAEPGMILAGWVEGSETVLDAVKRLRADVVILEEDRAMGEMATKLLSACPQAKLFVIANNGRSAARYSFKLNRLTIEDVSPSKLITAIYASTSEAEGESCTPGGTRQDL
jgi:hypothetical protein